MTVLARALNIVMHRRLCQHEAGHAAAALIGGLDVREVWAGEHDMTVEPDDPDQAAGHVLIAVDRDNPAELREHAITVLAGPLSEDKTADGGRRITGLDVFEITVTPSPMNNDTRVLNTKAVEDNDPERIPSQAELERDLIRHGIISERANADQYRRADPVLTGQGHNGNEETKAFYDQIRGETRDAMLALFARADTEHKTVTSRKAAAPVQIATFEC